MLREVIPQLGLGEDDQAAVAVGGFLAAPEVDEAGEGELAVEEVQSPDARQLCAGIAVCVGIALEELLVHHLYAPRFGEVGGMTIPCRTNQCSLLEAARAAETAVILDMGGEGRLFAEVELA